MYSMDTRVLRQVGSHKVISPSACFGLLYLVKLDSRLVSMRWGLGDNGRVT